MANSSTEKPESAPALEELEVPASAATKPMAKADDASWWWDWRALLRHPMAPLVVACAWLLLLGLYLRVHAFDFPTKILFDEHHFVENARNYLEGRADWNDHPPLGKLVIAAAIERWGDGPVAWRLPALGYGLLTIGIGGLAAARLFSSRAAGVLAAAFLAADGFLIAYSRAGLLDGALATAAVTALLAATLRRPWAIALVGGLAVGFGMSIKFSGVTLIVPVVVALLLVEGRWRVRLVSTAATMLVALVIYFAQFSAGLSMYGADSGLGDVLQATIQLYERHVGLTDMKHPLTSGWPTWVVPVRPLVLGYRSELGAVRALSALGNLALWWGGCLVALLAIVAVLRQGLDRLLASAPAGPAEPMRPSDESKLEGLAPSGLVRAHGRSVVLALTVGLAIMSPWVLSHRDSYIYHFLPSYAVFLVLLGGYVGWVFGRHKRVALGYVAVVAVVAGWYAPVWSFTPLSHKAYRERLLLESWR